MKHLFAAFLALAPLYAGAQNATDVQRYASDYFYGDAYTLSTSGAFTMFGGSVASGLLNPASLALAKRSEFSTGFGLLRHSENATLQPSGTGINASRNASVIPDFSFLLRLPTVQGSLVMGWSVARSNDYSRRTNGAHFNTTSTIADQFVSNPFYFDSAWDAYAFDSVGGAPVPVWRLGAFSGVDQEIELLEKGGAHDLSFFWATEFRKNVFFGMSTVIPFGNYTYRRTFIEPDYENRYADRQAGSDVTDLVAVDEIKAYMRGAYFRAGVVVKPLPILSLSAAYRSPTRLNISETYTTTIQTRFDNGDDYTGSVTGDMDYRVRVPGRLLAGAGLDFGAFQAGVTAEWTDFSTAGIDFKASVFDRDLAVLERSINTEVRDSFQASRRLSGAFSYKMENGVTFRGSLSTIPDVRNDESRNMTWLAGGLSWQASEGIILDFAARQTRFESSNVLYSNGVTGNGAAVLQSSDSIRQLHLFTTVRFTW